MLGKYERSIKYSPCLKQLLYLVKNTNLRIHAKQLEYDQIIHIRTK